MRRLALMSALVLALGCRARESSVWLLLTVDPADKIELDATTVTPASALIERRHEARRLAIRLERGPEPVVVRAPGACPLTLTPDELAAAAPLERRLESLFDLGPPSRVVGFDERFVIRAVPRCPDAERVSVELTPVGGAPLYELSNREDGRALAGRTRGAEALGGPAFGIVPVSAARRAATQIRARLLLADGSHVDRELELAAGTRASGLPNVAVDHSVLLRGESPKLVSRPGGSTAELVARGSLFELVPDRGGAYGVTDARGRKLSLRAGLYDEVPLDCGRSECHRALSDGNRDSPMTSALAADLGGRHSLADPACALLCHATGEPGRRDGGFASVFAELGAHGGLPEAYSSLPRALRRLSGVGCLACHGPGAIPEASARWAVLRSDVCAVCHDAPPRYGHVAALATTRMARSDHDATEREGPACARCHTTYGALGRPDRKPPPEAGSMGIDCAACHDVHPHGEGAGPPTAALLRATPIPSLLDASSAAVHGPGRVCLSCHAPDDERPSASATAIWAGRGGIDPETGEALVGSAPHATEARGCVGCHDAGPDSLSLGKGHAFRAPDSTCSRCHEAAVPRAPALAARARALLDKLVPPRARRPESGPPHALPLERPLPTGRKRALHDILLVLEDPAADVHNRKYATFLLDRAESALSAPAERGRR